MGMFAAAFLFSGFLVTHSAPVAGITRLAAEMRVGHMGQYGKRVEGN